MTPTCQVNVCPIAFPASDLENEHPSASTDSKDGGQISSRRRSRRNIRAQNEEDQRLTEDRLRRFNETYPLGKDRSPTRSHIGNEDTAARLPSQEAVAVNKHGVDEARDAITRRLTQQHIIIDDAAPTTTRVPAVLPPLGDRGSDSGVVFNPSTRQKRLTRMYSKNGIVSHEFNEFSYNPDGTSVPDGRLRTMHTLPDFEKSIKEAKKTRYVRHKKKQWFETELSVNDIFHDNKPQTETYILYKPHTDTPR